MMSLEVSPAKGNYVRAEHLHLHAISSQNMCHCVAGTASTIRMVLVNFPSPTIFVCDIMHNHMYLVCVCMLYLIVSKEKLV